MDFGKILDQWDDMQKTETASRAQGAGKKANAPDKTANRRSETNVNPQLAWMNRYGVVDKDKVLDESAERRKQTSRSYLRGMKAEATLDLHGLTADEARTEIERFVTLCKRRGIRKIMLIHGKGIHSHGSDPVLGKVVRDCIERDKRLGMSGHPDRKYGGTGATWVLIK